MVDIGDIISTGFKRTFKRNGLMLAGLMFLINIYSTFSSQTFLIKAITGASTVPAGTTQYPLAANLPILGGAVLYAGAIILSIVVSIGTIRTLVSSETETLPRENFTENILKPFLNLIAGGIIFGLAIGIAYAGPAVPGYALYLAGIQLPAVILLMVGVLAGLAIGTYVLTSLFFYNFFIIVEGQNFIESFRSSWEKTEGDRLSLFAAGFIASVITGVIAMVIGGVLGIIGAVTGTMAATTIVNLIPQAFVSIFTLAAAAEAYRQIT
jgi:uncharacterized membrane protein YedE/YeeE